MNIKIIQDDTFKQLKFTHEWIALGLIDSKNFVGFKEKYLRGEDKNTEHYRWGAFWDFLQSGQEISHEAFYRIYDLGKKDPDPAMGRSMRVELIRHVDCPKDLVALAIKDDKDISQIVLKLQKKGLVKSID